MSCDVEFELGTGEVVVAAADVVAGAAEYPGMGKVPLGLNTMPFLEPEASPAVGLLSKPTRLGIRQISPEYPFFFFLSGEYPFLAVYRGSTPPLLYRGITPPPNIRPHCRCRQSTKPYSKSISGEYLPPDKTPLSLPLVHEACTSSKNISGEYPPPPTLDPAVAAASPQSLCF